MTMEGPFLVPFKKPEILEDGQAWLDALEDRNLTTHTYDENTAIEIEQRMKTCYFPATQQFYRLMKKLPLPYFFDVLHYEAITNDHVKQHIDEHGVVLFSVQKQ